MLKRKAFTLIELLVVIAIIGILSGMIVLAMSNSTQKATTAKSEVFFNSVRSSLMEYVSAEWKFEERSGTTATDSWWHIADGTITGATYDNTAGNCVYNSCLNFSGSGQYVTVAHANVPVFTTQMTALTWVKGISQSAAIIAQANTTGNQRSWGIYSAADKLRVALSADGAATNAKDYYSTSAIGFDNNWHMVGFTYDAGTLTLYIDGVVVATSITTNGTCNSLFDSAAALTIGCDLNVATPANLFTGKIDDTRLFSKVISYSQIKETYYAGLNNLLASGGITADEYSQRINKVSLNK